MKNEFNNQVFKAWCQGRTVADNHIPYSNVLLASALEQNGAASQIRTIDNETHVKLDTLNTTVNQLVSLVNKLTTNNPIKTVVAKLSSATPHIGDTGVKLNATVTFDNGRTVDATELAGEVKYDSNDKSKATVDENGNVTLLAAGEVTFTVTVRDKSGDVVITIAA